MPFGSGTTMTSDAAFPRRFSKVDELALPDHPYLSQNDICYFIGEYTARKGYAYSNTNDLILNFKKEIDREGKPEWRHKGVAIQQIATTFREAIGEGPLQSLTFVPVPPSVSKADPMHDDRLSQMLWAMNPSLHVDIRELVVQTVNTPKSSRNENRLPPSEREKVYRLDESLTDPAPNCIAIVDDLLTTGSHFKAMEAVLVGRFPCTPIIGLFVARRVPDTDDPWDFHE